MAYGLKYYKELDLNGKTIRLEIHKKDYSASAIEIGAVLRNLSIDIQGQQDDIDAPIVKTSAIMAFVDAYDLENGKKNGFWEEFYTPDALMWLVVIKVKNGSSFKAIWSGYVTPDSYSESLTYRGDVALIARDNIGHLNDFTFDAVGNSDGMIDLLDLINEALAKASIPMVLNTQAMADAEWLLTNGTLAYNTYMNISAFEGMSWYEALESVLYAYGLVLRYVGNNELVVYPLRNLPKYGYSTLAEVGHIEPIFEAGATRELTPSVRKIEESVSYDADENINQPLVTASQYSGSVVTSKYDSVNVFGETQSLSADVWPLTNTTNVGWGNPTPNKTLLLNPYSYMNSVARERLASDMLILLNSSEDGEVVYKKDITAQDINVAISFSQIYEMYNDSRGKGLAVAYQRTLKTIKYGVSVKQNGVTNYWNGKSWTSSETKLTATIENNTASFQVSTRAYVGQITIGIHIYKVTDERLADDANDAGYYVSVGGLVFASNENAPLLTKNNVNTIYDTKNNVVLSRDPKIGPAMNTPFLSKVIKNGIFWKNGNTYEATPGWYWGGQTEQQMAVYNHLQLLCYYAKPNNTIVGTILNADISNFAKIYDWEGAEHLLISGTLNLLNGFIENATLREFARYEDMWGNITDTADFPDTSTSGVTNAGAVKATQGSDSYTNNTTIVIGSGDGGGFWKLENDVLLTDYYTRINNNLIVDGDIASGGSGQAITAVTGIKLNGKIYRDSDDGILDGVINLGTIESGGGGIESITKQMVIDALQYTPAKESDLANYLPLAGGKTMTGWIRTSYKGSFLEDESGNGIIGVNLPSGAWSGVDSGDAFGSVVRATTLRSSGDNLYHYNTNRATAYKIVDAYNIGDMTSGYAKMLTTGTYRYMTFSATDKYVAFGDAAANSGLYATYIDGSNIYLRVNKGTSVAMSVASNANVTFEKDIIVKGDVASGGVSGSAGAYLPISGGTLNASSDTPLILNNTSGGGSWLGFQSNGATLGWFGYSAAKIPHIYDASGTARQILHPGNISSFALPLSGGTIKNGSIRNPLTIDTDGEGAYMNFSAKGTMHGYIGINTTRQIGLLEYSNGSTLNGIYVSPTSIGLGTSNPTLGKKVQIDSSTWDGFLALNRTISQAGASISCYTNGTWLGNFGINGSKQFEIQGASGEFFWVDINNGKTTIGRNAAQTTYMLDVNGQIRCTSVSQTSDIRYKDKIDDVVLSLDTMADAPLFIFKWNNNPQDHAIYLGTSAQYWEGHRKEVVSGDSFKGMDYATLGVAMGISNARITRCLEARIRDLEAEVEQLRNAS